MRYLLVQLLGETEKFLGGFQVLLAVKVPFVLEG